MRDVAIDFRPLPASTWIADDPAFNTSTVSIHEHVLGVPLTIVGVTLNGEVMRHRVLDVSSVVVHPRIPRQGDRLRIHCQSPKEATGGPPMLAATRPSPNDGYGLQAPTRYPHGHTK